VWSIIYNFLISADWLGGAMEYESTAILCRYLATAGTLAIGIGLIMCVIYFAKRIAHWLA
jgi:hypothetical protein